MAEPARADSGGVVVMPREGPSPTDPSPPSAWRSATAVLRAGVVTRSDLAVAILASSGVVIWWESLRAVPLGAMTDIGLASVLPPETWLGFLLVGASFFVALRSGRTPAIALSIVATVLVLHGLGVVAEPETRFHVAWRHIGIADYLRTRGAVDPELDAYQNWPGFFAAAAFLWEATGLRDPPAVLAWTPVVHNLLYLLPLVAIGNRIVGDQTVTWLAAWLFTVSNWIGQDYFSPQGWYLFVYLVVLAVLLEYFKRDGPGTPGEGADERWVRILARRRAVWPPVVPMIENRAATPVQRTALLAIVLLLVATIVSGHQLTPFALVLSAAAAVVVGWCRIRILPVIFVIGTLLWTGYAANAYVSGHSDTFSQLGAIFSIFEQTVEQRLAGSPGHELIVRLRLLETPVLWALAAVGGLRLLRSGRKRAAWGLGALAFSSFPLLAAQSYGGEALMRIAFFALPFMALLAAVGLVGPVGSRASRRALLPAVLVGALLVAAFPLTRYGNERMDWYAPEEVVGVQAMYGLAPPGSVLTAVTGGLPWRSVHYADYDYRLLVDGFPVESDPDPGSQGTVDMEAADPALIAEQVASRMAAQPGQRSFLVVSRSQGAELDLMGPFPAGAQDRLLSALGMSGSFRLAFTNGFVTVFELAGGAT